MMASLSTEQKTELLRRNELFADLEAEPLRELAERARELEFPAGHHLVRQGEIGTGWYVIVSGRAQILRHNERVDDLGPGDSFGELAIIDREPRSANVRAEEPLKVLALASWELNSLLEQQPKVTLALLRQVVRRLRPHLKGHRH
jgi:CRP/FNR family transcriptional regulator, cyclic AMP receptor protein